MKSELIIDAPIVDKKRIWIKKHNVPQFKHPFHYHLVSELTWIEKGHGNLIIGDYVGTYSDNELVMEGEKLPHLWKTSAPPEDYKQPNTKAVAIYFPSDITSNFTDEPSILTKYEYIKQKAKRGIRFKGKEKEQIIHLIKKLDKADKLDQLGYFIQIIQRIIKIKELECLSSANYIPTTDKSDLERFDRVYQFLLENFTRDIKLEEVSNLCYVTPNYFCKFFKSKTQKNFTQFLNELRISHACKLLQANDDSVVNIGYRSGYNTPVYFFKSFKRIMKQTPKEYRDSFNNLYSK